MRKTINTDDGISLSSTNEEPLIPSVSEITSLLHELWGTTWGTTSRKLSKPETDKQSPPTNKPTPNHDVHTNSPPSTVSHSIGTPVKAARVSHQSSSKTGKLFKQATVKKSPPANKPSYSAGSGSKDDDGGKSGSSWSSSSGKSGKSGEGSSLSSSDCSSGKSGKSGSSDGLDLDHGGLRFKWKVKQEWKWHKQW